MKTGNVLFSAVQFLFAALVVLMGGCLIGLQYAPHARFVFAHFIEQSPSLFFVVGYGVLGSGILLLTGFYFMHRGVYYRVKMGAGEMRVDPVIVRRYVHTYWKEAFPEQEISVEVGVSQGHKLEIFLTLAFLSQDAQMAALENAEPALTRLLQKHLGYKQKFSLSILVK